MASLAPLNLETPGSLQNERLSGPDGSPWRWDTPVNTPGAMHVVNGEDQGGLLRLLVLSWKIRWTVVASTRGGRFQTR